MSLSFLGRTRADHAKFMLSLCRLQHISVPLIAIHYFTWSVVLVAFYSGLLSYSPLLALFCGGALVIWLALLDAPSAVVYALFSVATAAFAWRFFVPVSAWWQYALLPVVAVAAVAFEGACHLVFQGCGPTPPPVRAKINMDHKLIPLFLPYFVFLSGIFWITLDLSCRFAGRHNDWHKVANDLSNSWHRLLSEDCSETPKRKVEKAFRLRVIQDQGGGFLF